MRGGFGRIGPNGIIIIWVVVILLFILFNSSCGVKEDGRPVDGTYSAEPMRSQDAAPVLQYKHHYYDHSVRCPCRGGRVL